MGREALTAGLEEVRREETKLQGRVTMTRRTMSREREALVSQRREREEAMISQKETWTMEDNRLLCSPAPLLHPAARSTEMEGEAKRERAVAVAERMWHEKRQKTFSDDESFCQQSPHHHVEAKPSKRPLVLTLHDESHQEKTNEAERKRQKIRRRTRRQKKES